VLQLTVFGEASIGAGINPLLIAKFGAPDGEKRPWLVGVQESRVQQYLGYVADQLGANPYLVGDHLTLADISVCCALGIWTGALGLPLPHALVAYRDGLAKRPAYQRARRRRGVPRLTGRSSPRACGTASA
jgi:glutathione S-transferase